MKDYLKSFTAYLTDEKKCSENTYNSYLRDVKQYIEYCNSFDLSDIGETTEKTVHGFMGLTELQKSKSTQMRLLSSLRCYYGYLFKKKYISSNPVKGIRIESDAKKSPQILSNSEIIKILSQPSGNEPKACRDRAMLEIMYATGIKVSELISLKITDVSLSIGVIRLNDKHERIIPLYPQAIKSLTHYINEVRPVVVLSPDEELLFTNMSGQALSRQGFWKIVKYYAEQAGIKKDITPYTFRHSFAAHMLENGADVHFIKDILGHTDISTTNLYANLIKNKYTLSYNSFHPLAKK